MFVAGTGQIVANPTTAAGGGVTAVVAATGTASNGSGDSVGEANGSSGSYVIQGGYMLAGSGTGSSGNGHGYPHPTRASPATVSINEGEDNSVPSADKKVWRQQWRGLIVTHRHSQIPPFPPPKWI